MSKIFNPFRYFVIPIQNQMHVDHYMGKYPIHLKNQLIKDFFKTMSEDKKVKTDYRSTQYLLYFIDDYDKRYTLMKLAKGRNIKVHEEGDFDITDTVALDYPYIYLIFDQLKQIILIEHNTNTFLDTFTGQRILEKFINDFTIPHNYEIKINPMLVKDSFWKVVREAENIFEIELEMESPNLFDGIIDTEAFLKKIKAAYNNNQTLIKLSNRIKGLTLSKKNKELEAAVDYIGNGGGNWKMVARIKGHKKKILSGENLQIIRSDDDIKEIFKSPDGKVIYLFQDIQDVIKDNE